MASNGTNGTYGINGSHFGATKYPPFPKDLPSVKLETFSLAQLEKEDKALEDRLFETCKERGFFYLDLNGSSADGMQKDADNLVRLAEKVHRLPQEEKDKYPMKQGSIFGYCHSHDKRAWFANCLT